MKPILFNLLVFISFLANAQQTELYGTVTNESGDPLAFTTVFIRELNNGTTSNSEGKYEISVPSGTYTVYFQYVGYETQVKTITVAGARQMLNASLSTQTLVLRDVTVTAGDEDPAYTIMRKAIAKSRFHTQQLDRYTARVYIKGSGKLKDAPFFLRKRLEKLVERSAWWLHRSRLPE